MPMKIEINSEIVKKYGLVAGAGVVGIAAAKDFSLSPDGCKPSDVLQGCVSVIVLGSPFMSEALSMNPPEYTELRNEMVSKMTDIAKKTAKQIKAVGYKAKEISATGGKHIEGKYHGHISLKHAAEIAGLGVITRNYLLTNPQHGNLLWLSAVLTDADLVPDVRLQYYVCGNCNKCVEVCPSGALDDPDLFGRKECDKFFVIENKKLVIKCFKCRAVCPYRFGMS
jgi:epoxyqueuosine reductase QueG